MALAEDAEGASALAASGEPAQQERRFNIAGAALLIVGPQRLKALAYAVEPVIGCAPFGVGCDHKSSSVHIFTQSNRASVSLQLEMLVAMSKRAMTGPDSLFRKQVRQPISITLTRRHDATLKAAMQQLDLSRSDGIGLLIDVHADALRIPHDLVQGD